MVGGSGAGDGDGGNKVGKRPALAAARHDVVGRELACDWHTVNDVSERLRKALRKANRKRLSRPAPSRRTACANAAAASPRPAPHLQPIQWAVWSGWVVWSLVPVILEGDVPRSSVW